MAYIDKIVKGYKVTIKYVSQGEKLVINGLNPQDQLVLSAASYGLKEITLTGRKDITQIIEDLSRRTEAARSLISPFVELTSDESHWMAEAVSRKIQLEHIT